MTTKSLADKIISGSFNTQPGRTVTTNFTSEAEIREQVMATVDAPTRKVTEAQLKEAGVDVDDNVRLLLKKQTPKTREEKLVIAEQWIKHMIKKSHKENRLMTDQQLADWRLGRKLGVGDKVRYIGDTRNELCDNKSLVPRPQGQTGVIVSAYETKHGRNLIMRPDKAVTPVEPLGLEPTFVDLHVREYTPGWLFLERIPL